MQIRIADIIDESVVDGPGIRLTIFTQGCPHHCPECHNQATHDFNGGYLIDEDEIIARIQKNPLLDGVTLSGGDPMIQSEALVSLAKKIKALGLHLLAFTGYTWEELMKDFNKHQGLLEQLDILIDGRFNPKLKSLDLRFAGSSNQRVIDVQKSLAANTICLIDWDYEA